MVAVLATARPRAVKRAERIHDALLKLIRSGTIPVGGKLPPEKELQQQYSVSRTIIRECLSRLRAEGLIVSRHGSGNYVRRLRSRDPVRLLPIADLADLLQWQELRTALESEIACFAAERRTREDIARIGASLDALHRHTAAGRVGGPAHYQFHRAVAQAAHNSLFLAYLEDLFEHIEGWISLSLKLAPLTPPQRAETVDGEHDAIYEAVKRRDSDGARLAMKRHLLNGRERLLRGVAE